MRRKFVFGVLVLTVLAVFSMIACDNGTAQADDAAPLVVSDVVNGKVVEITISRTDPSRAALYTPKPGDFYEIKYGGVIVSKGKVTAVSAGGKLTFAPDADSPGPKNSFTGTYSSGFLNIPYIPTSSGNITDIDASPEGGTDQGGSNNGTGNGSSSGNDNNGGTTPSTPTEPNDPDPGPGIQLGTLTLRDIPAEYNGMSADAYTDVEFIGYEYRPSGYEDPLISGNTVAIPLWGEKTASLAGITTTFLWGYIYDADGAQIVSLDFGDVTFSASGAELSWNDAERDYGTQEGEGTYTDGALSLRYISKSERDYTKGGKVYKEIQYTLQDSFNDAIVALEARYGEHGAENINTDPTPPNTEVLFSISDYSSGGWGKVYHLMEYIPDYIGGQSALWNSAEIEAGWPTVDSSDFGVDELNLSGQGASVSLPYTSGRTNTQIDGMIWSSYELTIDSIDYDEAKAKLGTLFKDASSQLEDTIGTPGTGTSVVELTLFVNDYTGMDDTHPDKEDYKKSYSLDWTEEWEGGSHSKYITFYEPWD